MHASINKTTIITLALTGLAVAAPYQSPQGDIDARQAPPNQCGGTICSQDKPLCCGVYVEGMFDLQCTAGSTCPPLQPPSGSSCPPAEVVQGHHIKRAAPAAPSPTFGPKCGDSFFCKPGQVCCTLYTCADTPEQCPPQ